MGKITRQELHPDLRQELDDVYNYIQGSINDAIGSHMANQNNPHGVTKIQVGLGNVINELQATKSEFDAHVATANPHNTTASDVGAVPMGRRVNAGNGLAGGGTLSADRTLSLDVAYLDQRYLGINKKAEDSKLLDGLDHTAFLKSGSRFLDMGNNDGIRCDEDGNEFYFRMDGRDFRAYSSWNIKYGTSRPSGGRNGDIYIQI